MNELRDANRAYGEKLAELGAELPDSTKVFIPGETVPDPPCLPQDWDNLYAATLESIRHPLGMKPGQHLQGHIQALTAVIHIGENMRVYIRQHADPAFSFSSACFAEPY